METRHRTKTNKVKTLHRKPKKDKQNETHKKPRGEASLTKDNPGVKLHSQRITQG
jgi:hypothetical protein